MDFIEVYPDAIPLELCDQLIQTIDSHDGTYQGKTGGGVDVKKKNSLDLMLDAHAELNGLRNTLLNHTFERIVEYFNKYYLALIGAISIDLPAENGDLVTLTPENFSEIGQKNAINIVRHLFRAGTVNVQKYEKGRGGYPHWHSEQFPQLGNYDALHRVVFFMYYLNDVAEGGETEFFYQNRKISPKKGTLVIAPTGFTHSHRGNIPITNDKYIATSWILFNPAEKIYNRQT